MQWTTERPTRKELADALRHLLARAYDELSVKCTNCGIRPCLCNANRKAMNAADDLLVGYQANPLPEPQDTKESGAGDEQEGGER